MEIIARRRCQGIVLVILRSAATAYGRQSYERLNLVICDFGYPSDVTLNSSGVVSVVNASHALV